MGQSLWKREQDLNLRLPAYEAGELPDCSTPAALLPSSIAFHERSAY